MNNNIGTAVPTVRKQSESRTFGLYLGQVVTATLIRINLRDSDAPEGSVSLL